LVQLPPQTEFYLQTGEQTSIYFLVAGKVQVNYAHTNGRLSVLAMMLPLALIGDLELFSYDTIQTNVMTLEPTVLLGIEKEFVLRFGYDDPRFLRFVIHHLTSKLYQTSLLQTGHSLPLINRLAAYLLTQPDVIPFDSKADLAGLMGTTTRHLNRVFKTLETENLIHIEQHTIHILDRAELQRRAQP
jgi:CRP-like cAMP-binding protein